MGSYTYKYRVYPNEDQKILLGKHFGCCRFIWNYLLARRKEAYLREKKSGGFFEDCHEIVRSKSDRPWLSEVNAQSLQQIAKYLHGAYGNFFARRAGFPRFKTKRERQSCTFPQHNTIRDGRLCLAKFRDGIKIKLHRQIEGAIKHVTITRNKAGQYFACVCVDRTIKPLLPKAKAIGVDLGLQRLATLSDGKTFEALKPDLDVRIRSLQRSHSRKQKGSKNREKVRLMLARAYQRVADRRSDYLHKVSTEIVRGFGAVVLEDLDISAMQRNRKTARGIQRVGLAKFVQMLRYKAKWNGREIIQISRWFPSSKTCSECDWIKQDLALHERRWECPQCGTYHDRDLNAAKNILRQGLKPPERRS